MGLGDASRGFASGVGKVVGVGRNVFFTTGRAVKGTLGKLRPRSHGEKIRSLVSEELSRLTSEDAALAEVKIEERLKAIAEALRALQEKIDELSAHGPVREADMRKAMGSVKAIETLSKDEKAILMNVFRQNIALQRPDLIDLPVGET